jgi:hypothetical protein
MVILLMFLMHVRIQLLVNFIDLIDICYKKNHLCVPLSSMHELLVCESYKGGLIGHFGVAKT